MQSNNKKKICIVVSSLGKGGAEKASATLSKMLNNIGYRVYIVSVLNRIEYSFEGELFNLGEFKDNKDTFFGRIVRLIKFKNYLKKHQFDCVIDNRSRVSGYREFILNTFVYKNIPVVFVIHNYKTSNAFSKYNRLSTYLYKNRKMVAVSNEARDKFKVKFNLKDISTIYNAFDGKNVSKEPNEINAQSLNLDNYIIFFGRIDDNHKNLKLLLSSYKQSVLPEKGIKLLILGDGKDLNVIKEFTLELNLKTQVVFKSFVLNPSALVINAKFTVLTSRFEGFPMVLLESLSVGTPVISVNCKSGPKEIIINEKNGLLVENYNAEAFANAMSRFIIDETLYKQCKDYALESVERFSMENVSKDWKQLIDNIG